MKLPYDEDRELELFVKGFKDDPDFTNKEFQWLHSIPGEVNSQASVVDNNAQISSAIKNGLLFILTEVTCTAFSFRLLSLFMGTANSAILATVGSAIATSIFSDIIGLTKPVKNASLKDIVSKCNDSLKKEYNNIQNSK